MNNAIIYTHSASPNEQSLRAQLKACREYAKAHGNTVIAEYSDNGYSGMNFNRQSFIAMNDSIEEWQTLIIYSIEKLSRNLREICKYFKALRDKEKTVVSLVTPFSNEFVEWCEYLRKKPAIQNKGV